MDITVYNESFQAIYMLENYESLLWIDRYFKEGEFEIYTPVNSVITDFIKAGYYLSIPDSEHMMIVEDLTMNNIGAITAEDSLLGKLSAIGALQGEVSEVNT